MEPTRCTARSSRTHQACRRYPIRGGTVCPTHGGSIKRVKKAARERLEEMVDPALTELRKLIETADSDSVKLSAIKDVLDRAGYVALKKADGSPNDGAVHVTVKIAGELRGDSD